MGLPIFKKMTDNGDGTYSADYMLSQTGSVTVSVELLSEGGGGAYVEYFDNNAVSGAPVFAKKEMKSLNFQWGFGLVTPSQSDNVSARWYFKLIAPYSETFTFFFDHDAAFKFYLDGQI